VLLPIKLARWTVPPSVEGSVKSGALSPTFNVLEGEADSCANTVNPDTRVATRSLLFILTMVILRHDVSTKAHTGTAKAHRCSDFRSMSSAEHPQSFDRKLTWPQRVNSDPENVYCNAAETG
jgi:hypothetical protein